MASEAPGSAPAGDRKWTMTEEERSKRIRNRFSRSADVGKREHGFSGSLTASTKAVYTAAIFNELSLIDVGKRSIHQLQPKHAGAAKEEQQVWRL